MRYLAAKKSVDERALNCQVWRRLLAALPRATPQQPLRILEVGAGIGSMVERLVAGDVLTHATYTAIDRAPALLAEAHRRLCQWARERGFEVNENRQGQLQAARGLTSWFAWTLRWRGVDSNFRFRDALSSPTARPWSRRLIRR